MTNHCCEGDRFRCILKIINPQFTDLKVEDEGRREKKGPGKLPTKLLMANRASHNVQ